jgi:hypothetical protein
MSTENNFFAYYFLKVHSSKIKKVIKKSQNTRDKGFSNYFLLEKAPNPDLSLTNPDPPGPKKIYGPRSGTLNFAV